jgi:hypothetical protein
MEHAQHGSSFFAPGSLDVFLNAAAILLVAATAFLHPSTRVLCQPLCRVGCCWHAYPCFHRMAFLSIEKIDTPVYSLALFSINSSCNLLSIYSYKSIDNLF